MSTTDTPWGAEHLVLSTEVSFGDQYGRLAVRKVEIDAEEMTAVHRHSDKHEILFVQDGLVEIQVGDDFVEAGSGDAHFIEAGTPHQVQNMDDDVAELVEVGFPFDPDDVVWIDDPYESLR